MSQNGVREVAIVSSIVLENSQQDIGMSLDTPGVSVVVGRVSVVLQDEPTCLK